MTHSPQGPLAATFDDDGPRFQGSVRAVLDVPAYSQGAHGVDIVGGHVQELRRRNLSPGTIYKRERCGLLFARWLAPRPLTDARLIDVELFLDQRRISARTRYDWISHLHRIYDYAIRYELATSDPTASLIRPKVDRLLPRPIPDHDLAEAVRQSPATMRAWLLLGALAGLRVSEIAKLERSDVLESDMLLRIMGKGGRERIVPLHPEILSALRVAGLPRSGHLFVRPLGTPYPAAMVSREISTFLASIGVDATAHQLRHWFGTKAYRGCPNIRTVQELLGHASPTTTAVYTAVTAADARRAVDGLAMPG